MNASAALPLEPARPAPAAIGLWVFIGVASMLFALFVTAYAMRMDRAPDWTVLALPRQLWLSTALLVAGSALLARAAAVDAQPALVGAGLCALAFVACQLWAWQALAEARVSFTGNPAASFFYVLTALHGLHVGGGLVAWWRVWRRPAQQRIALLARYWHFLLVVWLVLFAALGWLTPNVVAFICGRGWTSS
jgi:cytochrome c oxidase subunit III